jgi:hypothetical protein
VQEVPPPRAGRQVSGGGWSRQSTDPTGTRMRDALLIALLGLFLLSFPVIGFITIITGQLS